MRPGRGWWGGLVKPGPSTDPQVLFIVATNPIRRQRGGSDTLVENLWPKLEKIVVVENRMSATALQADILLPAAMQYERPNLQYAITHSFHVGFSEPARPPAGESKTEWEIFKVLSRKVQERSVEQGVTEYLDGRRQPRRLDTVGDAFTANGTYDSEETVMDEWLRDSIEAGTLPENGGLGLVARTRDGALLRPRNVRSRAFARGECGARPHGDGVRVARRRRCAVPDAHPPGTVPDRPPLVRGGWRRPALPQGKPGDWGRLPVPRHQRTLTLDGACCFDGQLHPGGHASR